MQCLCFFAGLTVHGNYVRCLFSRVWVRLGCIALISRVFFSGFGAYGLEGVFFRSRGLGHRVYNSRVTSLELGFKFVPV